MRGRLAVAPVAVALLALAASPARSTAGAERPRVHRAGVAIGDPGAPRTTAVPRLVRSGSDDRAGIASPGAAPAAPSRGGPLAPTPVLTFDGVPEVVTLAPGDPTGALGVSYHLAAVNVQMNFYDRLGTKLFANPKRLRSLDTQLPAGVDDFDPKVFYDGYRQTFVLAFASASDTKSFLSLVVIPEGAENDTSQWCVVHMAGDQVTGNGKQLADYPMLGFTDNRVTLTTNQFDYTFGPSIGNFRYVQIVSFRKWELYDCSVPVVHIKVFSRNQTEDPDGSRAFTISPAISIGGAPQVQWMVSVDFNGATGKVILWRIRSVKGILRLDRVEVGKGPMSFPPWGRQCGGTGTFNPDSTRWDTGDLRITSTWWDADLGRLYAATAVAGNVGAGAEESVIRWWEIDPASAIANSTISRKGIVGTAGRDAAWGSVATDGDGNLWVNYAQAGIAGTDECLSAYAAVVHPGSTTASKVLLRTGDGRFETGSGIERWGDFTAVSRDPTDPTVMAMYGQYPLDDGGATPTRDWQQTISTITDV
jgi:hypothetical protein